MGKHISNIYIYINIIFIYIRYLVGLREKRHQHGNKLWPSICLEHIVQKTKVSPELSCAKEGEATRSLGVMPYQSPLLSRSLRSTALVKESCLPWCKADMLRQWYWTFGDIM